MKRERQVNCRKAEIDGQVKGESKGKRSSECKIQEIEMVTGQKSPGKREGEGI